MKVRNLLAPLDQTDLILIGLTVLGTVLRLYGLEYQSLWLDELWTWRDAQADSAAQIWESLRADRHPPGYQILIFYWQKVFGSSEAALRMPSAIAGVLSIPAIFLLGRDLYSRDEGIIAAALLTVAWTPIRYSQEARAYALLLLLAIATTWLLLQFVKELAGQGKPAWRAGFAYVLLAVLACYLHYFGVVLVLFQATAFAVRHWNRPAGLLWGLGLFFPVAALYAPWLLETLSDLQSERFWAPPLEPLLAEFHKVFSFLLDGKGIGILGYVLIGFLLLATAHRGQIAFRDRHRAPTLFLLAWLIFPFGLAYLKSMISAPIMVPRYFLISLPALYLLIAHALVELFDNTQKRALVTGVLAAVFVGNLIFGVKYYASVSKSQFREAIEEVVAHESQYPGAYLIGWNGSNKPGRERLFDYYFRRLGTNRSVSILAGKQGDSSLLIGFLEGLRPPFFWYIYGHKDPDPAFMRDLKDRFEVVKSKPLHDAGLILFRTGFPERPN